MGTPEMEEAVTFEERNYPEVQNGIEKLVADLESTEDRQWRTFYHALEVEGGDETYTSTGFAGFPGRPREG